MKYQVREESTILEFLQKKNQGWSKSKVKSLISYHVVLKNGKVVHRIEELVLPGDMVYLKEKKKENLDPRLKILYEDEELIAVNKPFGLLSVSDASKEETMYQIVNRYVREKKGSRIFVLHRLDKDTSGVLLFAKNEKMKYRLQNNWNQFVLLRNYIAIVEGTPEKEKGTIRSGLKESSTHFVYSSNEKDAKMAITHYEVLKKEKGYTWLSVQLDTGRKNQIRVHMHDLRLPIAGDKKYGARTNPFKRLALHANLLKFYHPVLKKEVTIEAPLPHDLKRL